MDIKSTLLKNASKLGAASLINKILGYIRDAAVVWTFGGGRLTDAYFAVLRFITFFRRAFGEGALNLALLPEFARREKESAVFFSRALSFVSFFSAFFSLILILFRKQVISLISGGFSADPAQFSMAAGILAVTAFHVFFLSVYSLFQAFLNFKNRFFKPAAAQSIFSLSILAVLFFLRDKKPEAAVYPLAFAGMISGFFQAAILLKDLKKEGIKFKRASPFDKEIANIFAKTIPASLCLSQDYLILFISMISASFLGEGAVTAFYNSSRILQFPLSLIASSAAMASLRETSSSYAGGNRLQAEKEFKDSFKLTLSVILPAACGLFSLAAPISLFLFRHGRFTAESAVYTAGVLKLMTLSLPFFALNKLFVSLLYSYGEHRIASKTAIVSIALHSLVSLSPALRGLTLYSALAVSAGSSLFLARKASTNCGISFKGESGFMMKVLAASAATGVFAFFSFKSFSFLGNAAAMPSVLLSVFFYFLILKLIKNKKGEA